MAYAGDSEWAVRLALTIGLVSVVVSVGLVLQVLVMRLRLQHRTAQQARVVAQWRPLLLRASMGEAQALPELTRQQAFQVALLWNQLMDTVRGPSYARLVQAGERIGLHGWGLRWLRERGERRQLLALATLGHLARQTDWASVAPWLAHPRPTLSLVAARALVQMAPEQGVQAVLAHLPSRPDWPLARLDTLLREAGVAATPDALRQLLRRAAPDDQVRWLPLVQVLPAAPADALLAELLAGSAHTGLLSGALAQARTARMLTVAREATQHETWWIRVQAASALGRLGELQDLPRLVALMSDPQWWVRYRAAQAALALLGQDSPRMAGLWRTLTDPFARDMLQQVVAESAVDH